MTKRRPRAVIASAIEALHADDSPAEPVSAASLNEQTAARMNGLTRTARDQLLARFTGGTADAHHLSVRVATRAVASIQESVSAIAALALGHKSAKGKLPEFVLRATELQMKPTPARGSVVFELHRAESDTFFREDDEAVLDESFRKLFEVIASTTETAQAMHGTPEAVKDVGPRAARHIFQLCDVLVAEGMGIDFKWTDTRGAATTAMLPHSAARYLKRVAKASNSRDEEVELFGLLRTVSLDPGQKIVLHSDEHGEVKFSADAESRSGLGDYYGERVKVRLKSTETVAITSGAVTVSNELISIELSK